MFHQAAKEEEEKDEDGMWEETFKTFADSKPNGASHLELTIVQQSIMVARSDSCYIVIKLLNSYSLGLCAALASQVRLQLA